MSDCNICIEPYNKTSRRKLTCICDFSCCFGCYQRWLFAQHLNPHCMSCNLDWDRAFLAKTVPKSWLTSKYKLWRENILFESELGKMPATQQFVDIRVQIGEEQKKLSEIDRKIRILESSKYLIDDDINVLERQYRELKPVAKREFIRNCPSNTCNGFLSSGLKCKVCGVNTCKDCHEIKVPDSEHICDPALLENMQAIRTDSKPCPGCSIPIFKIDGCFAPDTEIQLWDSSTKPVQDIIVGDKLIGDDGTPRTVLEIFQGTDEMYIIKQKNGISYTVNKYHTLVFNYQGEKQVCSPTPGVYKVGWFCRETLTGKTKQFPSKELATEFSNSLEFEKNIRMTVVKYITLSHTTKLKLLGVKSNKMIQYPEQKLNIDPYLLGFWLGDGTHTQPIIATNDPEIQKYLYNWCENNGAELIHVEAVKFRIRRLGKMNGKDSPRLPIGKSNSLECKGYSYKKMQICDMISQSNYNIVKSKTNPFMDKLHSYNLVGNKHIPVDFLCNSESVRLKLLAGLIDSDGHLANNGKRIIITQTRKDLVNQIEFLSRSLGFYTNTTKIERKNVSIFGIPKRDYADIFYINISGNISSIPTMINRKKCIDSEPNKNYNLTSIEVIQTLPGKYYGFKIDNNNLFKGVDSTILSNCNQMYCVSCNTAFDWVSLRIETGQVHNPHYFEFLRRNGGAVPRNPADPANCGRTFEGFGRRIPRRTFPKLTKIYNWLADIHYRVAVNYIARRNFGEYRRQREDFILGNLKKDMFKVTLQRDEKKRLKHQEIRNVFDMFRDCSTDILYKVNLENTRDISSELIDELRVLVNYTNDCFTVIAKTYSNSAIFLKVLEFH